MTFTKTPPTAPGFYAWRSTIKDPANCCDVLDDGTCFLGGIMHRQYVKELGGEWCRLVPASELTDAWCEGRASVFASNLEETKWQNSRAKRVVEGTEP